MVTEITIFVDSNIFVSYYNSRDVNHEKAKKIIEDIISGKHGKAFASDYVFDESVTVCLIRTKSLETAKKLGEYMLKSEISLLKVTETIFRTAWQLFSPKLSFTDCTNIAFLKTYGIDSIATFDKEFKKHAKVVDS